MLKVILNRLKPKAEEIIAEEQAGFRAGGTTTEQTSNLKIMFEKYLQHKQNLHYLFIDSNKPLTEYCTQLYGTQCKSAISVQIQFASLSSSTTRLQVLPIWVAAWENGLSKARMSCVTLFFFFFFFARTGNGLHSGRT